MRDDEAKETERDERAEYESLIKALAGTPRLVRFLRFLGEKYFSGQIDELYEYNIATEVFGRSKATFDPAEDAIARVEAHRLRKKLREYYKGEGKDRILQLSLPPASYVPIFVPRPPESSTAEVEGVDAGLEEAASELHPQEEQYPGQRDSNGILRIFRSRPRILATIGIGVVLSALTVLAGVWMATRTRVANIEPKQSVTVPHPSTEAPGSKPIRLLSGYFGSPQIDSTGASWEADRYFHDGGAWQASSIPIAKTATPFLFQHSRVGIFSYDIPLRPGVYELHLYFMTNDPHEDIRTFHVDLNGKIVLSGFDIDVDAFGRDIADERVFHDVSPAEDGLLHIGFYNERSLAALNAIEILPGIPHRQLPIRLITRGSAYIDHLGQFWHPDDYFMEGLTLDAPRAITGTLDPDLYSTERYGHFSYTIPVDPQDRYTVVLHFAEHYFGPQQAGSGGIGSRVFHVLCNGETLLDNFDIFKEAGSLHALTKTFNHIKPSPQGKLNLMFEPVVNNATVSSIEVLDESK
jgi:hypothetical protein